jgi:hypothetical protein
MSASDSDGSVSDDVRDVGANAQAGAKLGTAVGGAQGAFVGAAAGAGIGIAKNPATRRRILTAAVIAVLVPAYLIVNLIQSVTQVGGAIATDAGFQEELSYEAATAEGLTEKEISLYKVAAEGSGTTWTVLAAIDRSAGDWTKAGDPPYGIKVEEFNKAAAPHGIDRLTAETAKDRQTAGYLLGRLFAALMVAGTGTDPLSVDAGAVTMRFERQDRVQLLVRVTDVHAIPRGKAVRDPEQPVQGHDVIDPEHPRVAEVVPQCRDQVPVAVLADRFRV